MSLFSLTGGVELQLAADAEQVLAARSSRRLLEVSVREQAGADSPHLSVVTICLKLQLYNT